MQVLPNALSFVAVTYAIYLAIYIVIPLCLVLSLAYLFGAIAGVVYRRCVS